MTVAITSIIGGIGLVVLFIWFIEYFLEMQAKYALKLYMANHVQIWVQSDKKLKHNKTVYLIAAHDRSLVTYSKLIDIADMLFDVKPEAINELPVEEMAAAWMRTHHILVFKITTSNETRFNKFLMSLKQTMPQFQLIVDSSTALPFLRKGE